MHRLFSGFFLKENKIDKQHVENMMGLTSMQAGMTFHYSANPLSQLYKEQIRLTLSGKRNTQHFKETIINNDKNQPLNLTQEPFLITLCRFHDHEKPGAW